MAKTAVVNSKNVTGSRGRYEFKHIPKAHNELFRGRRDQCPKDILDQLPDLASKFDDTFTYLVIE